MELNRKMQGFISMLNINSGDFRPNEYSPLVLAYIGDAVYELFIRSLIVREGNMQVDKIHKKAVKFVKAKAQSSMIAIIEEDLTAEELSLYKRGRNCKSSGIPKNADMAEYRRATGFEALIGYLYLNGEYDRLLCLLHKCIDKFEET